MHILVCDDDAAFAARMDEYISEWFRAREIQVQSTVCTSGEQLLATPELERYQLAFLDVDLKTTDGIALGRKLRQIAPDIMLVYISAYLEFAPKGYTVNAYRYLLKRDIAAQLPSCLEDIFSGMSDLRKTLEVHHNRTTSEIPLDQIYYLESDLRQINVYGDIPHQPSCPAVWRIFFPACPTSEKRWRCTITAPPVRFRWIRSIIWKAICGRSTSTAISRTSPSAPFTAKSPICPPCCTKTAFCRWGAAMWSICNMCAPSATTRWSCAAG